MIDLRLSDAANRAIERAREATGRLRELALRELVWALPRDVIYWAVIRAGAHATTGRWGHVESPAVTITEILERWRTE